jgi:hypothetical protein
VFQILKGAGMREGAPTQAAAHPTCYSESAAPKGPAPLACWELALPPTNSTPTHQPCMLAFIGCITTYPAHLPCPTAHPGPASS